MKKTMIVLFLALFLGMVSTDAKANVFASSVTVDFNGTFPATISYNLNQPATSVVITIKDYPGGNVVQTITIAAEVNGTLVGFNDVDWDGSLAAGGTASSGIFTIEIDASDAVGSDGFELTSFDTGPDSWYWSSSGVAANKRQTSPDFGTVYVTERTGGTSGNPGGIETAKGLYLHDSFGRYLGSQQNIAFAEGNSVIDWTLLATDEGAPFGATVGPDDRVYLWVLASNRDTPKHGGVAVGNALWSASSVETILDFNDLSNHNPISDAIVVGEGANRMLYTVEQTSTRTGSDNDSATDGDGFDTSEIKRYALGETGGLFSGSGEVVIPTSASMKNAFRIEMDSDGFLYVAQQSYASLAVADNIYGLSKWDLSGASPVEMWHVNLDAAPTHNDDANALNAQATNFNGLALDEPRGRVYVTRKNAERPLHNVLGYTMDTGNFWASFAASQSIVGTDTTDLPGGGGSSIRDVNVDAAGNVLIVNSSFEALRMYSPPDGANNFNTFSPWAIDVDNSTVIPTPMATSVDGLVAHYQFEGDFTDTSGNGLHGTALGGATTAFDADLGSNVLVLDGDAATVDIGALGDSSLFDWNGSGWSVAFWVKLNSWDENWQTALKKGDAYSFERDFNTDALNFIFQGAGGSTFSPINVPLEGDTTWHHIAATYDGADEFLYLDGEALGFVNNPGDMPVVTDHVFLGSTGKDRYFNGCLDDVRFYNIALTEDDVFALADRMATSVHEPDLSVPEQFQLAQNYPNPFNPSTTLQYTLPNKSLVQLTIYNLLGQRIRTLVNATQAPGLKAVSWDGTDELGRQVSSGIYLYRIRAGEFTQVRKMMLLK